MKDSSARLGYGSWALLLMLPVATSLVAGCDSATGSATPANISSEAPTPGPSNSPTTGQADDITDPFSEITDKKNPRYVKSALTPLLHTRGVGPSQYQLKADAGTRSVRVYIACSPTSEFTASVGKAFSGGCSSRFENFADIPVSPGELHLKIAIPATTQFAVVIIPTPSNT